MNDGLNISQREEWRNKHKIRIFLEERIVELQDLFVLFFIFVFFTYKRTVFLFNTTLNNKSLMIKVIITLLTMAFIMGII